MTTTQSLPAAAAESAGLSDRDTKDLRLMASVVTLIVVGAASVVAGLTV